MLDDIHKAKIRNSDVLRKSINPHTPLIIYTTKPIRKGWRCKPLTNQKIYCTEWRTNLAGVDVGRMI